VKRQKDLQAIKAQVDEFQKKKSIIENKVLVIERLRLAQKSPVHMLDEISKALPDFVWLTGMDEQRGNTRFTGRATAWPRWPTSSRASNGAAGSAGGPRIEPGAAEHRELHRDRHVQGS